MLIFYTTGTRPKTVGHSDDSSPISKSKASSSRTAKINRSALQSRLDVLRTSLDFELEDQPSSTQPSTEPSPRRYLPQLPDPEYETDTLSSPSVTRRGAMSPSLASVASGSTTASGTDAVRRRNLEWDSGADLGYYEG